MKYFKIPIIVTGIYLVLFVFKKIVLYFVYDGNWQSHGFVGYMSPSSNFILSGLNALLLFLIFNWLFSAIIIFIVSLIITSVYQLNKKLLIPVIVLLLIIFGFISSSIHKSAVDTEYMCTQTGIRCD